MTFGACVSTEHESAQLERESRAAQAAEQAKEQAAKRRSHGHVHASRPGALSGGATG